VSQITLPAVCGLLGCPDNNQEKPLSVDIDPTASDGGIPGCLNPPAAGSPPDLLPKTAEG
jgi:hypothetical protein